MAMMVEAIDKIGQCVVCHGSHTYSKKYPFGTYDLPTSRLDSCPEFMQLDSTARGQVVENNKCCYSCLSWKHEAKSCYQKLRVKCSERSVSGSSCGGDHHRLLHGSGVAYCHHTKVRLSAEAHETIHGGGNEED